MFYIEISFEIQTIKHLNCLKSHVASLFYKYTNFHLGETFYIYMHIKNLFTLEITVQH